MPSEHIPVLGTLGLDKEFPLDLDHFLGADYHDISIAAEELPPVIEWVNSQLQVLSETRFIQKQRVKEVEAEAYMELSAGGFIREFPDVKVTQAALERAVSLDDRVKKIHRAYAVTAAWCGRLRNLQESIQAKLDLVRSSEATRRRAFDGDDDENKDD